MKLRSIFGVMAMVVVILTVSIHVCAQTRPARLKMPARKMLTQQQISSLRKSMQPETTKTGLTLDKTEVTVALNPSGGSSGTLSVKPPLPSGGIKWRSTNKEVVTVDERGNFKGKGVGIASIIASTDDGTKEGECKVYVFNRLKNTVLGKGIDITKAESVSTGYIKLNNPIFDADKLNACDLVVQNPDLGAISTLEVTVAESVTDLYKELNQKNSVDASLEGVFSVSAKTNYNTSTTSNRATYFIKARAEVKCMWEYINYTDLEFLSSYLTPQFISDISNKNAAYMLDMYGSHVIASCYWGGIADLDYMYTSSKITNKSRIEVIVNASVTGIGGAKNNTEEKREETNFQKNHTTKVYVKGGNDQSIKNEADFQAQYEKWKKSVPTSMAVCGIDEFNTTSTMLPLWEIVKIKNPAKAKQIEDEFKERLKNAKSTLNNIKIYTPVVTKIEVSGQKGKAFDGVISGYNHVVLFDLYDRENDAVNLDDNKKSLILDANKGRGKDSQYVSIFYTTQQTLDYNGTAISDIVMLVGKNTEAPAGYTKIQYDLNAGCGSDSKFLWLAVKKATAGDTHIIDFIGGYYNEKASNLPNVSDDKTGKWEFVYKHDGKSKTSTIADLAEGCGGDSKFIRLVVHKIPRETK